MRGDAAAGEASGVSSVSMNGVQPADGGNVANGYAVNAGGTDGFLTSNQVTAGGKELGSVETFDQRYREEVLGRGSVVRWVPCVGAWARKCAAA